MPHTRTHRQTAAQVCPKIIRALHVSTLANCLFIRLPVTCLPSFSTARLVSRFSTRFPFPTSSSYIGCRLSTAAALYLHKTATLCKNTHTSTHRLHKYFIARVRRARHLNFVIFTKLLKMPPLRKNQSRNPPKKNQPVTCHAFPARPPLAKRSPAKKNSSKNRACFFHFVPVDMFIFLLHVVVAVAVFDSLSVSKIEIARAVEVFQATATSDRRQATNIMPSRAPSDRIKVRERIFYWFRTSCVFRFKVSQGESLTD